MVPIISSERVGIPKSDALALNTDNGLEWIHMNTSTTHTGTLESPVDPVRNMSIHTCPILRRWQNTEVNSAARGALNSQHIMYQN